MTLTATPTISTPRCQPWCDHHETDPYTDVTTVWHYSEPVEVATEAGQTLRVVLELLEPADDPGAYGATMSILGTHDMGTLDDCPVPDARRLAEAILALCDQAEAGR